MCALCTTGSGASRPPPSKQAPGTPRAMRSTQRQRSRAQLAPVVGLTASLRISAACCSCSSGSRVPAQ
eukprot:11506910-Alexandrium_andersonii.AAC.1